MKVVALNGSPRANGNTAYALGVLQEQFHKNQVDLDILQIGNEQIRGCISCNLCGERQDGACAITGDGINEAIQKIRKADGLILASPVYYGGINGTLKSALDRIFFVNFTNGGLFRHKVGASVAALRRSGAVPALEEMNRYFLNNEMILVGSNYWNMVHGLGEGEAVSDNEGAQCMQVLADNMTWVMKALRASKNQAPNAVEKMFTNFVR